MESESENTRFWIFHKDDIYIYKPIEKAKSPNELPARENYKIIPKIRKSKLLKTLKKEDCPEILSTLSANQAYNRKTIEKFTGNIKQIADSIILGEKLKIKTEDRLNYLSPVQFETLIFLIFHHTDIYVSTHRGGTKKWIDLQLRVTEQNKLGLNDHQNYNLQIKMYDYLKNYPNFSFDRNNYLIHTGRTDKNKNILGKNWIEDRIAEIDKVNRWLNFTLEHFEII